MGIQLLMKNGLPPMVPTLQVLQDLRWQAQLHMRNGPGFYRECDPTVPGMCGGPPRYCSAQGVCTCPKNLQLGQGCEGCANSCGSGLTCDGKVCVVPAGAGSGSGGGTGRSELPKCGPGECGRPGCPDCPKPGTDYPGPCPGPFSGDKWSNCGTKPACYLNCAQKQNPDGTYTHDFGWVQTPSKASAWIKCSNC